MLRVVGSHEVMREQLARLAADGGAASCSPCRSTCRWTRGRTRRLAGELTILAFPDLIAPDVVYLENMTSDLYVEQAAEVYRYGMAFDQLPRPGLSPPRNGRNSWPAQPIASNDLAGTRPPRPEDAEVDTPDLRRAQWRTSTHSANGSTCASRVAAQPAAGIVAVRDSEDQSVAQRSSSPQMSGGHSPRRCETASPWPERGEVGVSEKYLPVV